MKIESVHIQNLRSMKDETILLNDYTCLVGPNGAGKSNVICALNIFFRETADCATDLTQLDEEDFHRRNTAEPITITVTFIELDPEAQEDFKHYYRQGKLILSAEATFDPRSGRASVRQYGTRMVIAAFKEFFEAYDDRGVKVDQLRAIYQAIKGKYPELPQITTRDGMRDALRVYEAEHADDCQPVASEDEFYGVSRGANRLQRCVQWVYVPAVKDPSSEQSEGRNTALGKLLTRTVRSRVSFEERIGDFRSEWRTQYQQFLSENQPALHELSEALAKRVAEWSHPDAGLRVEWAEDADRSVQVAEPLAEVILRETDFEGKLARFGHGLQRCYLFALLEELSGHNDPQGPALILACEEPELYQHPPQAKHVSSVMQRLSEGNSQVLVCTHSPLFVSGRGFEDIRLVRKLEGRSVVSMATYEDMGNAVGAALGEKPVPASGMRAKIHQALQPELNEMFFAPHLILVEGPEDVAYITTYLALMELWDDYRRYGCHMIPTGGKNRMIQPRAVARLLRIPTFTVFDADFDEKHEDELRKHERDNLALLYLCGVTDAEAFPADTQWRRDMVTWPTTIANVVGSEIGEEAWVTYREEAAETYGRVGNLQKNALHISEVLELAWGDGKTSTSLMKLCQGIVEFGSAA